MNTVIIDYGTGNLRSVENALKRLGAEYTVTADAAAIRSADRVILPGVGEASFAMDRLRESGLDRVIQSLKQPVLGICIGMQILCSSSEEGGTDCLGIFHTAVRWLEAGAGTGGALKIPEMGWNSISIKTQSPLFRDIPDDSYVYYVHSFAPDICNDTIAVTEYGRPFSAALARDNFFGTQFHPEKSGSIGQRILENFLGQTTNVSVK